MLHTRTALAALALCAVPLVALTGCSMGSSTSASSTSSSSTSTSSDAGSSSSSNVARPTDMCALLSTAEASTAIGATIAQAYKGESSCDYSGEDEAFDVNLSPKVVDFATAQKLLQLDVGKVAPISGLGDQAVGNAKGLQFRKGSVIIFMQVSEGTTRTTEDGLIAVAKIILGHLG